jgi:hypothetical protein
VAVSQANYCCVFKSKVRAQVNCDMLLQQAIWRRNGGIDIIKKCVVFLVADCIDGRKNNSSQVVVVFFMVEKPHQSNRIAA